MASREKGTERASEAMSRRLPAYFRELDELEKEGRDCVSSGELAQRMGYTDSQIRHDLSSFGGFGRRGVGYRVAELRRSVGSILDISRPHRVIIVGAGNIGRALALYPGFRDAGFLVDAAFDSSPSVIGLQIGGLRVQPADSLKDYLANNPVDIAVIATPAAHAQETLDILAEAGVPGVWNFAGRMLAPAGGTIVHDVHLSDSLMSLSFRMHERRVLGGEKPWTGE